MRHTFANRHVWSGLSSTTHSRISFRPQSLYDRLVTRPPICVAGLAQNECLSRHAAGCRLLQVGEQSLALGLKFRAKVVLDIKEHPEGVPRQLIDDEVLRPCCSIIPVLYHALSMAGIFQVSCCIAI